MRFSYMIEDMRQEPEGLLLGLFVGADHVGEHQYGIERILQEICGHDNGDGERPGLARYRVRPEKCGDETDGLTLSEGYVIAWSNGRRRRLRSLNFFAPRDNFPSDHVQEIAIKERLLSASWSGSAFHLSARSPEARDTLNELMSAARKGDLIICPARHVSNPFHAGGMMFIIESRADQGLFVDL